MFCDLLFIGQIIQTSYCCFIKPLFICCITKIFWILIDIGALWYSCFIIFMLFKCFAFPFAFHFSLIWEIRYLTIFLFLIMWKSTHNSYGSIAVIDVLKLQLWLLKKIIKNSMPWISVTVCCLIILLKPQYKNFRWLSFNRTCEWVGGRMNQAGAKLLSNKRSFNVL